MTALPLAWQVLLAALRGSQDGADALEELERLRARQPIGIVSVVVADVIEWAKGVAAAGISDTDGAMHHLGRLRHPAIQRLAALDRLEAASRTGGAPATSGPGPANSRNSRKTPVPHGRQRLPPTGGR